MAKKRRLLDEYQFSGFRPRSKILGIFGDSKARVVRLKRSQKKRHAVAAAPYITVITTRQCDGYGICPVEMPGSTWKWKSDGFGASGVGK
jgi:hypothetical protein